MANVIAVINQKGGVGKSTTAQALGAGLRQKGYAVLFIDLDAQGNLSYTMGADMGGPSALEVLAKQVSISDAVQRTGQGDLVCSSAGLSGADMSITQTGKEYRLKEALAEIEGNYDFIIIDTPPALGILTINALTAATSAIIPAQADIYSLQGIGQLYGTLDAIKQYTNPGLQVSGILLTRYNARAVLSRDITDLIDETAQQLDTVLFKAKIRECIALKEAQAQKQDIFSYAAKCNASSDYNEFIDEFLERSAS